MPRPELCHPGNEGNSHDTACTALTAQPVSDSADRNSCYGTACIAHEAQWSEERECCGAMMTLLALLTKHSFTQIHPRLAIAMKLLALHTQHSYVQYNKGLLLQ